MNRYEQYLNTQDKIAPTQVITPTPTRTVGALTGEQVYQIACDRWADRVGLAMSWYREQTIAGRVIVWTGEHLYAY